MPLLKAKPVSDVPPGAVVEIESGDAVYALCNVDGAIHCLEGTCPHAGGPLGQGTLQGNWLVCPWHGFEYDCRTGMNDSDEDLKIQTYPVIQQDGYLFIDLPE